MTTTEQRDGLAAYAQRIREARRADPNATEPGLAPHFAQLLRELLPKLPFAPDLTVLAEYENPGVGRPDIALSRPGQTPRAFIELKAQDKGTDGKRWKGAHDKRQFARFSELGHWMTCNFTHVRLYALGDDLGDARLLPNAALDPDKDERAARDALARHDPSEALALIEQLTQAQAPSPENARQMAGLLARSSRLVAGIVRDRLAELRAEETQNAPIQRVRDEFKEVLYARPEVAGHGKESFDDLFAGAFAQTLAFGLLLVREATGTVLDQNAHLHMPPEHPLMAATLGVLSQRQVASEVGIGFDLMLDTVNVFEPALLRPPADDPDARDPILHFYEDFLAVFDPGARRRHGVFYTPLPVVRYMTSALDRALREVGTEGLADRNVHILDPATGTGTYLLSVADHVRRTVAERRGPGAVPAAMRGLVDRLHGFELLVGPYAVAHYRLHHALFGRGEDEPPRAGNAPPRLGVYLADTLAEPGAAAPMGRLGFASDDIAEERRKADRIKTEQQVLAIIGNPPYRRLAEGETATLVGRWMDDLWSDLKEPVRNAGESGQLNTFPELSVAFWRWAVWKLFDADDAPRRGVVAFITNRSFLTGWPYAGLRQMMRQRFDRIEVIDLRGDKNLNLVPDDEGVFAIKVGTAITVAIADGSQADGALAEIRYNDSWAHDLLRQESKLEWLAEGASDGTRPGAVEVKRGALDDMRPVPFLNASLASLTDVFAGKRSGMKSGDDDVYVAVNQDLLRAQVPDALRNAGEVTSREYLPGLERKLSFRPLDVRLFYEDRIALDRPGTKWLLPAWGAENVCLYTLPSGVRGGPAVWCHGLLPDYHAFRGSYGGYAFPPLRPSGRARPLQPPPRARSGAGDGLRAGGDAGAGLRRDAVPVVGDLLHHPLR
jgi:hypothetical protein